MSIHAELLISKPLEPAHELLLAVLLTKEHLGRQLDVLFETEDLTVQQYNVLRIVRGGPESGHTATEIGHRMIHRYANVTRLVDRLEARGLLRRVDDPKDRRLSRILMTPDGEALLDRLHVPHEELVESMSSNLSTDETRTLIKLLLRLRQPHEELEAVASASSSL